MTFTCEEPFLGDSILKTQRGKDSRLLLQYAESAQNSRAPGLQGARVEDNRPRKKRYTSRRKNTTVVGVLRK